MKMKPTANSITSWYPHKKIFYKCSQCNQDFRLLEQQEKFCHNCGTEVDWNNIMTELPEPFLNKDNYEVEKALIQSINEKQLNCIERKNNMKIYIPKNNKIRERVVKEINGHEEFDYTCNQNEYELLKEISEEEYLSLSVDSKEHMVGNVLVYENNEAFLLDGFGYFRIEFK